MFDIKKYVYIIESNDLVINVKETKTTSLKQINQYFDYIEELSNNKSFTIFPILFLHNFLTTVRKLCPKKTIVRNIRNKKELALERKKHAKYRHITTYTKKHTSKL